MLSLLLASSLFLGPVEESASASAVEFVARVTEERFVAVNSSLQTQVLLFRDREGGREARAVIAAGGEVSFDFPVGTLDRLLLRVVSQTGNKLASSADYALGEVAAEGFQFFWLEHQGGQVHAWGVHPLSPEDPIYVPATTEPTMNGSTQPLAPNVPVITPTDKPKGDLPPRIEEKPLPPV